MRRGGSLLALGALASRGRSSTGASFLHAMTTTAIASAMAASVRRRHRGTNGTERTAVRRCAREEIKLSTSHVARSAGPDERIVQHLAARIPWAHSVGPRVRAYHLMETLFAALHSGTPSLFKRTNLNVGGVVPLV